MKIARRKRAQAGNWAFNPGDAKSASRTELNSFQRAIFGRAQCLKPPRPQKQPAQNAARSGRPLRAASTDLVSARKRMRSMREGLLGPGVMTVGMTVLLSLLKVRATSALRQTLSKS